MNPFARSTVVLVDEPNGKSRRNDPAKTEAARDESLNQEETQTQASRMTADEEVTETSKESPRHDETSREKSKSRYCHLQWEDSV